MDVDFVILFCEKILSSIDRDRHRFILEGKGLFYAGAEMTLEVVLILLRQIKSR